MTEEKVPEKRDPKELLATTSPLVRNQKKVITCSDIDANLEDLNKPPGTSSLKLAYEQLLREHLRRCKICRGKVASSR